jgi:RNA polymerase sigma-70 factor, ECF subfamily
VTIRTSINWRLNAICSAEQVERIFREERGRIAAGLIRRSGSFDLAEEALQDVFASALQAWPADGVHDGRDRPRLSGSRSDAGAADRRRAIDLTENAVERKHLERQMNTL